MPQFQSGKLAPFISCGQFHFNPVLELMQIAKLRQNIPQFALMTGLMEMPQEIHS